MTVISMKLGKNFGNTTILNIEKCQKSDFLINSVKLKKKFPIENLTTWIDRACENIYKCKILGQNVDIWRFERLWKSKKNDIFY